MYPACTPRPAATSSARWRAWPAISQFSSRSRSVPSTAMQGASSASFASFLPVVLPRSNALTTSFAIGLENPGTASPSPDRRGCIHEASSLRHVASENCRRSPSAIISLNSRLFDGSDTTSIEAPSALAAASISAMSMGSGTSSVKPPRVVRRCSIPAARAATPDPGPGSSRTVASRSDRRPRGRISTLVAMSSAAIEARRLNSAAPQLSVSSRSKGSLAGSARSRSAYRDKESPEYSNSQGCVL